MDFMGNKVVPRIRRPSCKGVFIYSGRTEMINFKENEELNMLNHSCAHLMAQAVIWLKDNVYMGSEMDMVSSILSFLPAVFDIIGSLSYHLLFALTGFTIA